MKTIYLDSEFKCHMTFNELYTSIETNFFDGKCNAFIEGYRYCPIGESYIREDGSIFYGECAVPWRKYDELDAAQREYERAKLAQYEQELPQAYLDGVNSI